MIASVRLQLAGVCLFFAASALAVPAERAARLGLDGDASAPQAAALQTAAPALPPADDSHFLVPFANLDFSALSAADINDRGTIVGSYSLASDDQQFLFAFIAQDGVVTDATPPQAAGSGFAELGGLNQKGDAVGDFFDADGFDRGYLRAADGTITVLPDPAPGVAANVPSGINSRGVIVGAYSIDGLFKTCTGWVFRDGSYRTVDFDGATCVFVNSINDRGDMVGTWIDATGMGHGFLLRGDGDGDRDDRGRSVSIDVDGAFFTSPFRIGNDGEIVGSFVVGAARPRTLHGFVRRHGRVSTLDTPGARHSVWTGLTSNGILTGTDLAFHSFLALPLPR